MFQDGALLNPANAEAELAVALGDTPWPIPRGTYPSFLAYPKFVVDFQIEERKRIAVSFFGGGGNRPPSVPAFATGFANSLR